MTAPTWEIEENFALSDLKIYENNPRTITKQQFEKLQSSIAEDGYHQPLVINTDGTLISGHQRAEVMRRMGITKIRVVRPSKLLSPEEVDRINVRSNVNNGAWDFDILADRFDLEQLVDWGMDEKLLGNIVKADPEDEQHELPELQAQAISVPGQVWILGNHRLMCGSSTVATDVEKLLNGVKPHLMVTDPPYGVEYDADWRNKAKRADGSPIGASAVGKVKNDEQNDWRAAWALFPGDVAYVWHADKFSPLVAESLNESGFKMRNLIIWAKNHFSISRGDYHHQHEPCWYAVREKATGHWSGDRKQTTLWEIDKPQKSETGHSTQKPVECMRKPMENNSSPGQAVYEPFAGSSTTIIAGEQIGRHVYAMEIHPGYVDMGCRRWMNLTGLKAIDSETGEEFPG